MYISTPPCPEVENFQIKIYYPAGDRTSVPLNQRQTCYHLSLRGERFFIVIIFIIIIIVIIFIILLIIIVVIMLLLLLILL